MESLFLFKERINVNSDVLIESHDFVVLGNSAYLLSTDGYSVHRMDLTIIHIRSGFTGALPSMRQHTGNSHLICLFRVHPFQIVNDRFLQLAGIVDFQQKLEHVGCGSLSESIDT